MHTYAIRNRPSTAFRHALLLQAVLMATTGLTPDRGADLFRPVMRPAGPRNNRFTRHPNTRQRKLTASIRYDKHTMRAALARRHA